MDLLAFILAISAEGITDEQVQTALNAYIAEHPEAVTTVTDGSITKAKLHDDLADEIEQNTADVGVLKSALNSIHYYQLDDDTTFKYFSNHINHILEIDWGLESGTINNSTGAEASGGSSTRSGFIPIEAGKTWSLYDKSGTAGYIVHFYDSDKIFKSTIYTSNSVKASVDGYIRINWINTYNEETTLKEFVKGYWGLKRDYTSGMNPHESRIMKPEFPVVESNRIASDAIVSQGMIDKELTATRLTGIIENNNINLLDRTKLESGLAVNGEGEIITSNTGMLMRAMPVKPNTTYTFSLYSGYGLCYPCWLDQYAENVLSMITGTNNQALTITSPTNAYYLRFFLTNDQYTQDVMIVEGSTLPTNFVAYSSSLVKLKKNLLPEEILTEDFDTVEANRITEDALFGQKFVENVTSLDKLTSIIEDNSVNLFDRSKLEIGYSVDASGNIKHSGVGGRIMRAMPILPDTEYTFSQFNYFGFLNPCWLDSYGDTVISMITGTVGEPVTVTSPSNAYFLRFGFPPDGDGTPATTNAMIVKGNSLPTDFVDYQNGLKQIKRSLMPGSKGNKDWGGLKYIAFGDSRSCGYAAKTDGTVVWDDDESGKNNYPEMIGYYTGISVDNRAVPGGAYANRTSLGHYNLSLDYFTEDLPTDADIITIFLGTNDRVIGSDPANLNPTEERDDPNDPFNAETFKGAIRNGLKKIRAKMPEVPIILMVDDRGFNATAADGGTTRADMIREVAREAGLPVFDIALKGMNQDTLNEKIYGGTRNKYWYHTDILHESILGNKMLAVALAGEMAKYLW